jgi:hypothetical protein
LTDFEVDSRSGTSMIRRQASSATTADADRGAVTG